jgi:prepilin peptidase CpaA
MRIRRIPNLLTAPFFVGGLCFAACLGGFAGLEESIGGCVLTAAPYLILFLWAGGGAGDAKMMGAIGAWVGLAGGAIVLLCVALAA